MNTSPEHLLSSLFRQPVVIAGEDGSESAMSPTIWFDIYDIKPGYMELLLNACVAPDDRETVQ